MPRLKKEVVLKHSSKAWQHKAEWDTLLREAYEYAIPQRNPYHHTGDGVQRPGDSKGKTKTDRVFDSTLVNSALGLANRLQSQLTPPFQKWAKLLPGPFVPEDQKEGAMKELEPVTETIFSALQISNFDTAINEFYIELVVAGTACMQVNEVMDDNIVRFNSVCQAQVALREGPFGEIWGLYRKYTLLMSNIEATWPDAKIPAWINKKLDEGEDEELQLQEATYYCNKNKVWYYDVIIEAKDQSSRIVEREYNDTPWVVARWIKTSGEVQGRSPVMMALPDAKTLNKVIELLLKNASLAVSGVWMVRNDGTVNANNIRIFPGATIPVTQTGGPTGASIQPLQVGGDLRLAQLIIDDMKASIKRLMFDRGLPDAAGPVRSPTEIIERLKELQQDLGSPFGRITTEGIVPIMQKTLGALSRLGVLVFEAGKGIKLNDGFVQVQFQSPLAMSENTATVDKVIQWTQIVQGMGNEAWQISAKIEDAGVKIGELLGVPSDFMREDQERKDMAEGFANMIAQQQAAQQGVDPAAQQQQQIPV